MAERKPRRGSIPVPAKKGKKKQDKGDAARITAQQRERMRKTGWKS